MQHFKQRALALALSLTVAAGIAGLWRLTRPAPKAAPVGSWGLSFPTEGECPVGNAAPEALAEFDAAFVGDPAEPVIYLTFDAGYDNGFTGKILDVLKARSVPAAFFVTGSFVDRNPDLVRRMTEEGHIVGNHTYHHYDMAKIADEAAFTAELRELEDAYRAAVGTELPKYYRPPQGLYSEDNLRMAQALGYKTVFWSLAYVDWQQDNQPTSEAAFAKLIPRIHNGAVVLLHSTSATNAAILDDLLERWAGMGFRFGTLDELFAP
ncbi:MAG: polysaccharide deacetylase family protein [Oscillospiraceae bacterium]|nr:polysaccharide deacetylase family protein [Oscillospiraceae bacterium]